MTIGRRTATPRSATQQPRGACLGVIAEIELKREGEELELPRWIGKEVTGDLLYKKINMRAQRADSQR